MFRPVLVVVVALAVSAGASQARSESYQDHGRVISKVRVPYGDLDLSRDAGADMLLSRIASAAARACRGRPALGVLMVQEAQAYRACKAKAVEQAVAQVQAPLVKQRFAARSGPRPVKVAEVRP